MTQDLAAYWSKLTGNVHPDDEDVFRREPDHGFNLDYPPPAFIGDVVNAPIVILCNIGGYDPEMTPNEFADPQACDEYREFLSSPRPLDRNARSVSPYYLERNYTEWLISGEAALVNGVAYRSIDKRAVERLTKLLPSALFHRKWLRETLFPLAKRGEKFVVVHHKSRWLNAVEVLRGLPTAVFSTAPISPNLTLAELSAAQAFLAGR